MIYTVEFYSEAHDKVMRGIIEAPDRELAVDGVRRYYRLREADIRSAVETPDAEPRFVVTKIPGKQAK